MSLEHVTSVVDVDGAATPPPPRRIAGLLAVVVVLGLLAGAVTLARRSVMEPQPDGGMAAGMAMGRDTAPVALDTLNPAIAALYRHAVDHADVYRDVPCYCGCDRFADHRYLFDCFVRADGKGFEAHGAGCAICQAEARAVRELLDGGRTPAQVRTTIIDQFGPATNPAGT
jgi:hypothetical protein